MGNNLQYGVSQGGSSYGSQSMYNSNPVGQSSQGFDMSDYRYISLFKSFSSYFKCLFLQSYFIFY